MKINTNYNNLNKDFIKYVLVGNSAQLSLKFINFWTI